MTATGDVLLLDASVWLACEDPNDAEHSAAVDIVRTRMVTALDLTRYEVTNVAVRSWGDPGSARALLGLLDSSTDGSLVVVDPRLISAAIDIADRYRISVYDASYAAVASDRGCTLVSCDIRDLVSNGLAVLPSTVVSPQA